METRAVATDPTVLLLAGQLGRATLRGTARQSATGRVARVELDAIAGAAPRSPGEQLTQELDRLLGLAQLVAEGAPAMPPRLVVWAVADLAEAGAGRSLLAALEALQALVRGRYAPLFPAYRDDASTTYLCNVILALPPTGERWSVEAKETLARLEALHGDKTTPAALNNVLVVSGSSGRYRLTDAQLARMIATLLEQAIWGPLGADADFLRTLRRQGDPYATFACATCELDEAALRDYLATCTSIELLEWLRRTSAERADVDKRAAEVEPLFDIGRFHRLVPLEKGRSALARVIDTQCPDFAPTFRDVSLFEDTEEILGHYGEGWARDKRDRLRAATRELGMFRLDETIEEVESNGAQLVAAERERIDRFVDEKLGSADEGNVADAALLLRHLKKRLGAEVDAARERATAPLAKEPDLTRFDKEHERFVAVAREKPSRRRMLVWGALLWAVMTCALALLLRRLVPVLRLADDSTLATALSPPWAWLTATLTVGTGLAIFGSWRQWQAVRRVRQFVGEPSRQRRGQLEQTLAELSRGTNNSLLAFYGSRFTRACDIWVHRTLKAVLKHVEDRYRLLTDMLATFERQVQAARQRLRSAGVEEDKDGTQDTSRVLADDGALVRSLVDSRELPRLYEERRKPKQLAELVRRFCEREQPFAEWRRRLPLADLDALVAACRPFHESVSEQPVLLQPDLEEDAKRRLSAFVNDLAPRLDPHLDFTGQLYEDLDDVGRQLGRTVVFGAPVADLVEVILDDAAAGDWKHLVDRGADNRIVLLQLITGIAPQAIRWHDDTTPAEDFKKTNNNRILHLDQVSDQAPTALNQVDEEKGSSILEPRTESDDINLLGGAREGERIPEDEPEGSR